MTSIITVPAGVVPLLYSGLQLHIREHILPKLDGLYRKAGRAEHPEWFPQPFIEMDEARELMLVIDWPRDCPPALEADIEINLFRGTLRAGLKAELHAQREHLATQGTSHHQHEAASKAIRQIEGFLTGLPLAKAAARVNAETDTNPLPLVHRILNLLLREDHDERWSRVEIESELYDIQPILISDALSRLREDGILHLSGELTWASRCARRLHALETAVAYRALRGGPSERSERSR